MLTQMVYTGTVAEDGEIDRHRIAHLDLDSAIKYAEKCHQRRPNSTIVVVEETARIVKSFGPGPQSESV